jgi:hypothetical protein
MLAPVDVDGDAIRFQPTNLAFPERVSGRTLTGAVTGSVSGASSGQSLVIAHRGGRVAAAALFPCSPNSKMEPQVHRDAQAAQRDPDHRSVANSGGDDDTHGLLVGDHAPAVAAEAFEEGH